MNLELAAWPKVGSLVHVTHNRHRYYRALNGEFLGDFVGSTSVLKAVLGLSKEPLIQWAVGLERTAIIEAATELWEKWPYERTVTSGMKFAAALDLSLGKARQHQKALEKAADLGTEIHSMAEGWLKGKMGVEPDYPSRGTHEAQLAFLAFKDRWTESGLKPVLMEQTVYDTEWGFAGTIDIVAECPKRGLGVVDLKSSKGIYSEMHLQVASYLKAGRNFADLKWAELWRLPKTMGDLAVEVRPLGKMYDRELTEEQCAQLFHAALILFTALCHKEEE